MDVLRFDLTAPPGLVKEKRKFHSRDALSAFFAAKTNNRHNRVTNSDDAKNNWFLQK